MYGRLHPIKTGGCDIRLLPVVYPRQVARVGTQSSTWGTCTRSGRDTLPPNSSLAGVTHGAFLSALHHVGCSVALSHGTSVWYHGPSRHRRNERANHYWEQCLVFP